MWDIFDEVRRMQDEMDRMFGDFYGKRNRPMLGPGHALARREVAPLFREAFCDVSETEKDVIVTAELPGMEKGDISVNVTGDAIEIRAEKKGEKSEEKEGEKRQARFYSGFYRSFALPSSVEPDKVRATYNNGVLEITLPKSKVSVGRNIKVE